MGYQQQKHYIYNECIYIYCFSLTAIWNEHKVLQDRMKRKWEVYAENRPKVDANWDRNAKRSTLPSKSAPAKLRAKPKMRKEKGDKNMKYPDDNFVDIEFKTPPLTPPPPTQEKVAATNLQKDDDFWEFYDQ